MFGVFQIGNRWTWHMICAAGRVLAYTSESWETDMEAAEAAKSYRVAFWRIADQVDHRMARCI